MKVPSGKCCLFCGAFIHYNPLTSSHVLFSLMIIDSRCGCMNRACMARWNHVIVLQLSAVSCKNSASWETKKILSEFQVQNFNNVIICFSSVLCDRCKCVFLMLNNSLPSLYTHDCLRIRVSECKNAVITYVICQRFAYFFTKRK